MGEVMGPGLAVARRLGLVTGLVAACLVTTGAAYAIGEKAHADMRTREGRDLGRIKLIETMAGVLFKLKLKGLNAGGYGFHIHEFGKCDGDFESAGNIFNPLGAKHGYLNNEGPMVGDLPNLFFPSSGELEVELLNPFVTLSRDAEDTLVDLDGASLVIFERLDDYKTDPIGNAGSRLACGVITSAK
jgi:superoxide dismutase, Cu-Zn family